MKRPTIILIAALIGIVAIGASSGAAGPDPQVLQLKRQLRVANLHAADLQDQIDAQNGVLADQNDTITRLRYRLANQPDPLDVITARSPDGLWQAMRAIWLAFPTLDPSLLCGYDRAFTPADDGGGIALTSFTFYRWTGC